MPLIVEVLKENQRLQNLSFMVCIVGSRKLSESEGFVWTILEPNLTILGFDVDEDACNLDNLQFKQSNNTWIEKYIPIALSNKIQSSNIYVTKAIHCSSLYPPNESYLARFMGMDEGISLDFTVEVETTTLDDFCLSQGIQEIDFLQVDVQGADLDVLQGAINLLNNSVLGIQVEVEFSAMYKGQPLFSDIDIYLRNHGFTFFDLITTDSWCRRPRSCSPIYSSTHIGQLLWADARYIRDPISESPHAIFKSPNQILKLACIADILNYPDYSLELLAHLTLTYGEKNEYNFAKEIMTILSHFPNLVEQGLQSLPIVTKISPYLT